MRYYVGGRGVVDERYQSRGLGIVENREDGGHGIVSLVDSDVEICVPWMSALLLGLA